MRQRNLVEPLERRDLFAITWSNMGPKDGLAAMYGANAPVARTLVQAAIADWSAALPTANLKLTIKALDIEKGSKNPNTLGRTSGKTIQLDKDAAGEGWYFDSDVSDNADFPTANEPFAATGKLAGRDFFSVVLHEIGHAVGFADTTNPAMVQVGRNKFKKDVHHSGNDDDLMATILPANTRRLISQYDISHTTLGKKNATPMAPRSFAAAAATTGLTAVFVSWSGFPADATVEVFRSASPIIDPAASGATLVGSYAGASRVAVDTSATSGTPYYYLVVPEGAGATYPRVEAATSGLRAEDGPTVEASAAQGGAISVQWPAIAGVTLYNVYRSADNGGTRDRSDATLLTQTSTPGMTDFGLRVGSGAYYWVSAIFPNGGSADFPEAAAVSLPPTAPTGTATTEAPYLKLQWSPGPSDTTNVASWAIYRSTTNDGSPQASGATLLATLDEPTFQYIDFSAQPNTTYYYWVTADAGSFGSEHLTADSQAISGRRPLNLDLDFARTGSVVASKATAADSILATWDPIPGATAYDVSIAIAPIAGTTYRMTQVAVLGAGATSFTYGPNSVPSWAAMYSVNVSPLAGWTYYFNVQAETPAGPVDVGTDRGVTSGFTASSDRTDGVAVSWAFFFSSGGYDVYRSTENAGSLAASNPTLLSHVGSQVDGTYLDTSAEPGMTYSYWILPSDGQEPFTSILNVASGVRLNA